MSVTPTGKPKHSTAWVITPWTTPAGDLNTLFSQAHTLARAIGTALHEAHALAGLGRCAHRSHDVPTATTAFTQALTRYQRLGSPETTTVTSYLADLHHDTDQHPDTA
jgi:hypothetical protein